MRRSVRDGEIDPLILSVLGLFNLESVARDRDGTKSGIKGAGGKGQELRTRHPSPPNRWLHG